MSCEVEKALAERFAQLFKGLDPDKVENLMEDLIDHYTYAKYGLSVVNEIRKVKNKHSTVSIQPIADVGILVSPHGFEITSVTQHPKGGSQVIMKETTRKEFIRERDNRR